MEDRSDSWREEVPDAEIFNAVLEISSEVVWVTDFRKEASFWIASAGNRKKYGLPDFDDNTFWINHIHLEDVKKATEGFQAALHNPALSYYEHEYRFHGSDDMTYIVHDAMRFFRDEQGKANRVVGVWKDVTDIYFKEERLQSLLISIEDDLNRFRIISNISNATMWEVDTVTDRII